MERRISGQRFALLARSDDGEALRLNSDAGLLHMFVQVPVDETGLARAVVAHQQDADFLARN